MSEQKAKRTMEEIQKEYANSCTKLGDLYYRKVATEKDIAVIIDRLRDVNFEAAALVAEQKAAEQPAAEESKGA